MSTENNSIVYRLAEAASYLSDKLQQTFTIDDVSRLAKENSLLLLNKDTEISRSDLDRYITSVRMREYNGKALTEEKKLFYRKCRFLEWWEAIYIAHGMEPSELSAHFAPHQFPKTCRILRQALDEGEIGKERKTPGRQTWIDTPKRWEKWFSDPNHLEWQPILETSGEETFESLLATVKAKQASPKAKTQTRYDQMAKELYRMRAELPDKTKHYCAEKAVAVLKKQGISATTHSILRRVGRTDWELLKRLQAMQQKKRTKKNTN